MFSKLSILFAGLGAIVLITSYKLTHFLEILLATGFLALLIGLILSFAAYARGEKGKMKLLAGAAFFTFALYISWNDPLHIVRVLTWLKN
ncbi:hypothetical protein ACFQPF_09200 [Fictibacillus iocasae]|uniref:DUF3953 domain-containing protein n=1 Tax=Fictibacillus iocasae TaxID=2715437 RepID=A0ABW2NRQ1_9BACL